MVNRGIVCIFCIVILSTSVLAAAKQGTEELIAPTVAEAFGKMGMELLTSNPDRVDDAMVFLQAGILLDQQSGAGYEQYLRGAGYTCQGRQDYRDPILQTLSKYVDYKSDLEVASRALACVIDQTDSRQERESILGRLESLFAGANPVFASDIAAQVGLYAVEKTDYPGAVKQFESALQMNPYNLVALGQLMQLLEPQTKNAEFIAKINWLRLKTAVNPADLQAVVELGQAAYRAGLYEIAADAFEYASELFKSLRPGAVLHDDIAVGLAQSCYFVNPRIAQSQVVADQVRKAGGVNLKLEAIAALAAQKDGKAELKSKILADAIAAAEKQIELNQPTVTAYDLGWFYSFAAESPEDALAWCNKAYKQAPDDVASKALMAYVFLLNQQDQMAEEYASPLADKDPIAMLTMAKLNIGKDQKQKAAELLNQAKMLYAPLPVALKIDELRKQIGLEGISEISPEVIREGLVSRWGDKIIPAYTALNKLFTVKLKFDGEEFFYGSPLNATLVVENTSKQPLVIGPQGLVSGRYRIDAEVRGDIAVKIPMLVERTFRPGKAVMPGESIAARINLNTGALSKLLFMYPQADLTIDFKLYVDPVMDVDGTPKNAIQDLGVIQSVIRRKKVELTREFLVQRLDALSKGQEGQKIRASELFCGLYAERMASKSNLAPYKHIAVDEPLLIDSVRRGILDNNWKVQVHTLLLLAQNSVYLDYTITESISSVLDHEKWPERLIAMWLLGQGQKASFQPVLDWKAENDVFWLNRQMALAMGAKASAVKPLESVSDPNQ